jgi:preprotein translocase subunit YajC
MSSVLVFLGYALLIALAAYVLVVRPLRRVRAQRAEVVGHLAPGSRVLLTSGLLARVVAVEDDEIVLDAGEGVMLRYVAAAVRAVLPEPSDGNSRPDPDVSDRDA